MFFVITDCSGRHEAVRSKRRVHQRLQFVGVENLFNGPHADAIMAGREIEETDVVARQLEAACPFGKVSRILLNEAVRQ